MRGRLHALLALLEFAGQSIHHFGTFVETAEFANLVRHDHLAAVRALDQRLPFQSQVAPATELLAFGHMMSWYCHSFQMIPRRTAFCNRKARPRKAGVLFCRRAVRLRTSSHNHAFAGSLEYDDEWQRLLRRAYCFSGDEALLQAHFHIASQPEQH